MSRVGLVAGVAFVMALSAAFAANPPMAMATRRPHFVAHPKHLLIPGEQFRASRRGRGAASDAQIECSIMHDPWSLQLMRGLPLLVLVQQASGRFFYRVLRRSIGRRDRDLLVVFADDPADFSFGVRSRASVSAAAAGERNKRCT